MRSFNNRAKREVDWRRRNAPAIRTIALFSGIREIQVGALLSKRIDGGRKPVIDGRELIGYA